MKEILEKLKTVLIYVSAMKLVIEKLRELKNEPPRFEVFIKENNLEIDVLHVYLIVKHIIIIYKKF